MPIANLGRKKIKIKCQFNNKNLEMPKTNQTEVGLGLKDSRKISINLFFNFLPETFFVSYKNLG